jgi:hypothetical protein
VSDAGTSLFITNVTLTFDDCRGRTLPDSGQIISGSYRPTDFTPGDVLPFPAPGAYGTNLFSLQRSQP